ncbi:MAG TPA: AAA family ATPase [Streptosporangiaceae bacterium]|nr:AAA family ATPase [Streptosporangiaceae bacterium]
MASRATGDDFVGRRAELALLHRALRDARAGRPAIVSVEGEPGIGKTRLLHRFAAEAPDVAVLWASGDEAEVPLDYGVAEQLWAGAPAGLGVDGPPPSAGAAAGGGFAVGAALLDVLGALPPHQTAAVVVDDLQWADLPSAQALLFAVRRLRRDNVLVLLASRPHSLARLGEGWSRLLAERARRIRLPGLTSSDLQPLAQALLGVNLALAARERLCEHTGGNPLYVRALLEELPAVTLADQSRALPAPHSYSALVLTRVAQLSRSAQDLLAAASTAGVHSSLPVVAAAAGIADPVPAFDEACAAALVTPAVRAGSGEITFSHPLIRAAIYSDLSLGRRRRLHLAVAGLLAGPEALFHRVRATLGPDDELSAELAALADSDIAAGELPRAAQYLLFAARLSSDPAAREESLLRAVELLLIAGDASADDHVEAVRSCRDGPHKRFVMAVLTATAGQLGEAVAQLEHLSTDPQLRRGSALSGRVAVALAFLSSMQGRGPEALDWANQALVTTGNDPTTSLTARQVLATALAMADRTADALALLAPLSAGRINPEPYEPELVTTRGALKASIGDYAGASRDLEAVVRWARAGAPLRSFPDAYAALAQAEYGLGDWESAVTHAELAVSLADDLGHFWFLAQARKVAVDVYAARGEWEFATDHVTAARQAARHLDVPGQVAAASVAEATLAWAQGHWRGVLEALRPLREENLAVLTRNFDPFTWRLQQAEALLGVGRLDQAAQELDEVAAAPARPPGAVLAVHRLRAGLALARAQPGVARTWFSAGLAAATPGAPGLPRALLAIDYARFLRAAGHRRQAIPLLRTAHQILSALSAKPFLDVCGTELSACGAPTTGTPVAANPHNLTAKEQVVARLVARGLSNREVAAEMYLSAKTIEYHLGNIYAKTGLTSRHQLAAVLSSPPAPAAVRPGGHPGKQGHLTDW